MAKKRSRKRRKNTCPAPRRVGEKVEFDSPKGRAYVKKVHRGEYVLRAEEYKERARWGNRKQICEDIAYLMREGNFPPAGSRW